MRHLRYFLIVIVILLNASCAFTLQIGKSAPKIKTYRSSPTQVVVYDARPELAINAEVNKHTCEVLNRLGIRLVRCHLSWNMMETTDKPGLYDSKYLAQWDALVEECRKSGIYIVAIVSGDPLGVTFENRKQSYERFAQFMADMARRYPSVSYWELFTITEYDTTCLFGAKNDIPALDQGKNYSEMLKIVSPAVKASNPSAWVLCCCQYEDFTRGIYDNGGKDYFDIMNLHVMGKPLDTLFIKLGASTRVIMSKYDDEGKPVWITELGNIIQASIDYRHEEYMSCFQKNNDLNLCEKLFILPSQLDLDETHPTPTFKWLDEGQLNQSIFDNPRTITKVFVPTKQPMMPVGYDYKIVDGGIEILGVVVDSLIPTRINLMYISEPQPLKPGNQPTSPKQPKNPRPIPDPFDI